MVSPLTAKSLLSFPSGSPLSPLDRRTSTRCSTALRRSPLPPPSPQPRPFLLGTIASAQPSSPRSRSTGSPSRLRLTVTWHVRGRAAHGDAGLRSIGKPARCLARRDRRGAGGLAEPQSTLPVPVRAGTATRGSGWWGCRLARRRPRGGGSRQSGQGGGRRGTRARASRLGRGGDGRYSLLARTWKSRGRGLRSRHRGLGVRWRALGPNFSWALRSIRKCLGQICG